MNFHEDPRFKELAPEDQQKILSVAFDEEVASDQRFGALDEESRQRMRSLYFDEKMTAAQSDPIAEPSSRGLGGFLKDTAIDAVKGIVGTGESVVGLADMATGNLVGKGLAAVGYDPKATNEILSSGYSPQRKAENLAVEQADGFVGTLEALVDHPAVAFGSIVESAPMSLGGAAVARRLATGMLARGLAAEGITAGTPKAVEYASRLFADPKVRNVLTAAGAATEGAQAAGSIQEQARQEGVPWSASVAPAVAAGIGTTGIGVVSSKIPGFRDAEAALASAGLGGAKKASLIAAGKELARTMFKEGALEELPQSAQEQAFTNIALGKPWEEGVPEAAAQGLVVGAAQGGGMSAASSLMDRAAAKLSAPPKGPLTRAAEIAAQTGAALPPNVDPVTGEVLIPELANPRIGAVEATDDDDAAGGGGVGVAPAATSARRNDKPGMAQESNQFADFLVNDQIDRAMAEMPEPDLPPQQPISAETALDLLVRDGVPVNQAQRVIRRPGPITYPPGQNYTAGKEQSPAVVFQKAYKTPGMATVALKSKAKTLGINPDDYAVMPDGKGRYAIKTATSQEREQLNTIPEPLRPAFQKMKESVLTNDAGGVVKDDEGYLSHRTASTYPDWFRQKPKDKQWQGGWSRDEFSRIVGKVEKGYQLGEKDAERYQELLKVADHLNNTDHELARNQDVDEMTGRGFEPVYDKVIAADLNKGDKLIADGDGLPRDEYEVKGVDKQGNIVLQDGVEVRVDPFDQIGVEGLKRGTTKPEDEQTYHEPPSQMGLGELGEDPVAAHETPVRETQADLTRTDETQINAQAHDAATSPLNDRPEPTQGQIEAGNYKKGHVRAHGFGVSIENPEGSERKGVDKSGKPWSITMRNHYGYIKGTTGYDKDHLDVFMNPLAPESDTVHVVNQVDPKTGKFDEHKVVFGYPAAEEAKKAYLDNYEPGWKGFKSIVPMSPESFREWATGDGPKKGELVGKAAVTANNTPDASAPAPAETRAPSGVTSSKPAPLTIEDFSEKSFIVRGQTKENMERIKGVGIRPLWNRRANGWIFPKKHEAKVRAKLADLLAPVAGQNQDPPKAHDQAEKPAPATADTNGARAAKQPPTAAEEKPQAVTRESFVTSLEKRGAAVAPDGASYSIQHSDHGGYYFRKEKDGIRSERGGDPRGGGWSIEAARSKAVVDVFGEETHEYIVKSLQTGKEETITVPKNPTAAKKEEPKTIDQELADSSVDDLMAVFDEVAEESRAKESSNAPKEASQAIPIDDARQSERERQAKSKTGEIDSISTGSFWDQGLTPAGRRQMAQSVTTNEREVERIAKTAWRHMDDKLRATLQVVARSEDTEEAEQPATATRKDATAKTASVILGNAAKAGVKGAEESLKGLYELFGGGSLKSFPGGIDRDTYAKAKPHFDAAFSNFQAAGKGIKDFFQFLVDNFSASIRPYVKAWLEERKGFAPETVDNAPEKADSGDRNPHLNGGDDHGALATAREGKAAENDRGLVGVQRSKRIPEDEEGRDSAEVSSDEGRSDDGGVRRSRNSGEGEIGQDGAAGAGSHSGGKRRSVPGVANRGRKSSGVTDYRIAEAELIRQGSWRETARRNLDIIELVKKLDAEGRQATKEEQALLAQYTGFGASEIANNLFPGYAQYGRIVTYRVKEGWEDLVERVQNLLTPEELRTAAKSTQYAHYTSEKVIRSIYNALERFGFPGGKILEPGSGSSSFFGLIPDSMHRASRYTGIEMDHVTAAIARHLYPQQSILQKDFTQQRLPDNFFDLGIGNPPFSGTVILADPAYKKNRFKMHDYFFAKTIDKVRPGGLLVFVTSRYTMDKLDSKARDYLAGRADLLGAIRLPQTAFKQNAGTDVVTDVLFLRKREDGQEPGGLAWKSVAEVATPEGPANINEYFAAHPEMVLGAHSLQGSMYRDKEYAVLPLDGDIEAHFAAAVKHLPEKVYSIVKRPSQEQREVVVERDFNPKIKKEGGLYLSDKGSLMKVEDGAGKALVGYSAKDIAWLRDYVPLRDAVKQAQYDQLHDLDWENSLKALNRAYDAFVKKHGKIKEFTATEQTKTNDNGDEITYVVKRYKNKKVLGADIESYIVDALEKETDDGIVKGPFLTGRTIKKPVRQQPKTLADALALTLDEKGVLDLDHVAASLGISRQEAIDGLGDQIYENPTTGAWETADEYLSGYVVDKLEEAEVAAKSDERFARNRDALLKAQPAPLTAKDIHVTLGAPWVAPQYIDDFASEVLGIEIAANYTASANHWAVGLTGGRRTGSQSHRGGTSEWGTTKRGANEILDAVLNNRSIKVTMEVPSGEKGTKTVIDEEATAQANDIAKKMRARFSAWVWEDTQRAGDLLDRYNRRYNNIAPRKFDGAHLTLPGVSLLFKLHSHQKRAIWRAIQDGNAYFAHAVGSGKTIEMIAAGMEMKRLGMIQKPMYVVPKHMLRQFSNEFMELYPLANIMVADEENFHTDNRRRFMTQAALNNPDAIIVTHPSLGKLGMQEESVAVVRDQMVADLRDALEDLEDDKQGNRILIKKVEKRIEQLEQMFAGMTAGARDQVMNFEEMGVDFLFVDEAHEFRKLDFTTNRQAKGIDSNGSQKAIDLFIKTKWLEAQRPGRSHIFASGTPVTNTMGELYTMMRFFMENEMEADGIRHFDAWASMFGEIAPGFERNAAGNYEVVERFAKFINVPELMKRVRSFMDVLTFTDLGATVTRPDIEGGIPALVLAPQSDDMARYLKETLAERIRISKKWKPSKEQPGNPDPIINIITDGRLAAIDMRFVRPWSKNDPESKLNKMADGIIKSWQDGKDTVYTDPKSEKEEKIKGSTQVVFFNTGFGSAVAKNRGFDARAWLSQRLREAGIPASDIAWIDDYPTASRKEALFKEMRDGKKRILIGSAKKMGTGMNVQRRLQALHYLDAPWYPADVEQPHGRILRQGNLNKMVNIFWYATEGSYDSTMWQMVARKSKFIEQALSGDDSVRTLDDISEASSYEMATAISSGDSRVIQLAGLHADIERLSRLLRAHHDEQISLRRREGTLAFEIAHTAKRLENYKEAAKKVGGYIRDIAGEISGKRFDKRKDFGAAVIAKMLDVVAAADGHKQAGVFEVGKLNGFTVAVRVNNPTNPALLVSFTKDVQVSVDGDITPSSDPTGLVTRLVNTINGLSHDVGNIERGLAGYKEELAKVSKRIGAPFEYSAELHSKTAEAAALESELVAEGVTTGNENVPSADILVPIGEGVAAEGKTAEKDGATGENQGGTPMFSRTSVEPWPAGFPRAFAHTTVGKTTGTTAEQVQTEARAFLKTGYEKLTRLGKLKIVQSESQLPKGGVSLSGKSGNIVGAYHNGAIHLVADQIAPGEVEFVLRHEGLHMLMREDQFFVSKKQEILGQFEKLRKLSKSVRAAFARVPADTAPAHVTEEAYAYFVQDKKNHQQSLVRRMIAAVKMWMFRMGIPTGKFTEADFVALATRRVKSFAGKATDKDSLTVGDRFAGSGRMIPAMASFAKQFGITVEEAQRQHDEVVARYKGDVEWFDKNYQKAGRQVDGRTVLAAVPNEGSIASSLDEYEILGGIREIPLSAFTRSLSDYGS